MPVANLQTYRTVALRVSSSPGASYQQYSLEQSLTGALRQTCRFEAVGQPTGAPVDLLLDLTVTAAGRGGNGFIRNQNLATIDTLLVLTDGQTNELLGSARIHGESSQVDTGGGQSPEQQAVDIVAKTVAELLGKSGCSGPRVARAAPPPPAPPPVETPAHTEDHRAEADALNEQGKAKVRTAELDAAVQLFQQANQLAPDARYVYNICLAYEAGEQWDRALASCKEARGMNARPELVQKIDHRIDLLQHHQ